MNNQTNQKQNVKNDGDKIWNVYTKVSISIGVVGMILGAVHMLIMGV